uniref:Uncharacterized protein n=1 Tax=Candidatus Kentrum sp. LPFa TaxID=2126335 RepID=A0A450W483_9GAMM|nr:MAG: hypothetical protein BECKLPF1236B_GA0070989_10266 [Candidatus Kentron sp. LPFa]
MISRPDFSVNVGWIATRIHHLLLPVDARSDPPYAGTFFICWGDETLNMIVNNINHIARHTYESIFRLVSHEGMGEIVAWTTGGSLRSTPATPSIVGRVELRVTRHNTCVSGTALSGYALRANPTYSEMTRIIRPAGNGSNKIFR